MFQAYRPAQFTSQYLNTSVFGSLVQTQFSSLSLLEFSATATRSSALAVLQSESVGGFVVLGN